ncbi:MAG: zf-HC2 domain-containing protein [Planctomycetota bacterium]
MRCRKFQRNLWAYLDGEAPERLRLLMEEHVATCASCRREVELARKADGLLGAMEAPAPSDGFVRDVMRKIAREPKARERVSWVVPVSRRALALATAAALVIAVVTFYLAGGRRPGAPPATTAEIEMLSDMDLLVNLDVLEHFEELQMLDVIEEFVDQIPTTGEANS